MGCFSAWRRGICERRRRMRQRVRVERAARPPTRQEGKAGVEAVMRGHSRGCVACHNGVGIGGQMFQKFGLVEEYWKATGSQETDRAALELPRTPPTCMSSKYRVSGTS